MATKEQTEKLNNLVQKAREVLAEAEVYADENQLIFYFTVDDRGFTYKGKGTEGRNWYSSSCYGEEEILEKGRWFSSSDNC